jgi:phosphate/sulfate permease
MIVASLGILVGAVFSDGMMEVARNGIFHPQNFFFSEIMIVFMAVMLTDILLLNFFNTIGLPTSTTVSIVFELLGAAVAIAIVKMLTQQDSLPLSEYINSSKTLAIISGILLSVVLSFTAGAIVQWLSRLLFSFNFKTTIKYFGAIWGGVAITAITYFILIKGAKESTFMTPDVKLYIKENTLLILAMSFGFWAVFMQLLNWIFNTDILKVVVLTGTFALAMAFAGNDLVNFIGVPLAGFEAFKQFQQNGGNDILMAGLSAKVQTPAIFLIIAGIVMVLTLWFSKKARTVTETELKLARQDEGAERFGSSIFARAIVGRAVNAGNAITSILPKPVIEGLQKRFDQKDCNKKIQKQANPPMFDLIRASVNLTVASILIAFATSLKLPLSTTYVTFMVAMGSSFADGAWGRDSAVYRITGVFAVIGGWFLTALVAFVVALSIAFLINWAGLMAIIALLAFSIFAIIKSNIKHKKGQEKAKIADEVEVLNTSELVLSKCNQSLTNALNSTLSVFTQTVNGLIAENRKELKAQWQITEELNAKVKDQKNKVHKTISKLQQDSIDSGHFYVQVIDYQRELTLSLAFVVEPILKHVENHHKAILPVQAEELKKLAVGVSTLSNRLLAIIAEGNYEELEGAIESQNALIDAIKTFRKAQIKRIKNQEVGTKNSVLYMNLLAETRNMALYALNMVKAQRDFVLHTKKKA